MYFGWIFWHYFDHWRTTSFSQSTKNIGTSFWSLLFICNSRGYQENSCRGVKRKACRHIRNRATSAAFRWGAESSTRGRGQTGKVNKGSLQGASAKQECCQAKPGTEKIGHRVVLFSALFQNIWLPSLSPPLSLLLSLSLLDLGPQGVVLTLGTIVGDPLTILPYPCDRHFSFTLTTFPLVVNLHVLI